jgi:hypothetical protein
MNPERPKIHSVEFREAAVKLANERIVQIAKTLVLMLTPYIDVVSLKVNG